MASPIYISVRIKSMKEISSKAVLLTAFDGSEDIFPKSVIFGYDHEVEKCEALWIAAWILPKKKLQYSPKKSRSLKALSRRTFRVGQEYDCRYYDLTGNAGLDKIIDKNIDKKIGMVEYFKGKTKEQIKQEL